MRAHHFLFWGLLGTFAAQAQEQKKPYLQPQGHMACIQVLDPPNDVEDPPVMETASKLDPLLTKNIDLTLFIYNQLELLVTKGSSESPNAYINATVADLKLMTLEILRALDYYGKLEKSFKNKRATHRLLATVMAHALFLWLRAHGIEYELDPMQLVDRFTEQFSSCGQPIYARLLKE